MAEKQDLTDKFTCSIPQTLERTINRVSSKRSCGKNDATRHLVDLALQNPVHAKKPEETGQSVICTLRAEKSFFASTLPYRLKHDLPNKKTAFLRDALYRGAAVFEAGSP